jgi:hypothetical protein
VSELEAAVVRDTLALVARTQERFEPLMRAIDWHPIPFFGALTSARVVTFGLNPSAGEFSSARGWPTALSPEQLATRLVNYFRDGREHRWFQPWIQVLALLGASYRRDAAHIDLSPRPTASAGTFRSEPRKSLFLDMLRTDAPLWIEALDKAPDVRLILLAGSATNKYYINEFIQSELRTVGVALTPRWRRGAGEGQTVLQTLTLPSGRSIPIFFCSTGPTVPGVLVEAARRNLSHLLPLLVAG